MPVEIPLTRGCFALVDEADAEDVLRFKWRVFQVMKGHVYAARPAGRDGSRSTIYMHRQILCARKGFVVDHFDNNGLNNQRKNIRIVTPSTNNVRSRRKNTNGYSGVVCIRGRYYYGRTFNPATDKDIYTKGFLDAASASAALPELLLRVHGAFPFTNDASSGVDEVALAIRSARSGSV